MKISDEMEIENKKDTEVDRAMEKMGEKKNVDAYSLNIINFLNVFTITDTSCPLLIY